MDGHNLLKGLNDMDYIQKQGINGPIWALIAFDSGNYPIPEGNVTREVLIDIILAAQIADGGWALSGETADADMTGMALQTLAPYFQSNAAVKAAVDKALTAYYRMQDGMAGLYNMSDVIDMGGDAQVTEPTEMTEPTETIDVAEPEPENEDGSGIWLWIILIIGLGVVVVVVIVKNRKKIIG